LKAKDGVIDHLNNLLTIELTAINQYFVQAEMCKEWGFNRLYKRFRDISLEEMEDAQHLIRHILYLEGVPNLQRLNQVMVGENVPEDLELNLQSEVNAVNALTDAISHCEQVQDYTTRAIFEEMIRSEEEHVDWLETQLDTIRIVGLELYLNQQIHED
jgi:bacterioferritin